MASPLRYCASTPKGQRGIATVLIVVLVGLGLTATSMGIVHSVRSTQQKQIAAHAITHAQAGAWTGVEVFRRYLASLTTEQLTALALNQSIDFILPGTSNSVNAIVTDRVAPSGTITTYQLKTRLTYTDTAAKSSAALEIIYEFSPPQLNNGITLSGELNFHRSTTLGGGITVKDNSGLNKGKFNVDGNLDLSSIGLTGLVNLNATGNITIGSDASAYEIKANGTVTLVGGAKTDLVQGLTGVNHTSGTVNVIKSNGWVQLQAGGTSEVHTTGKVDVAGYGTHPKIYATGNFTQTSSSIVTLAEIGGTSTFNAASSSPTITTLKSIGNVTCNNPGWGLWAGFTNIDTKGSAPGCKTGTNLKTGQSTLTVTAVAALTPFSMTKPRIDVWNLKTSANYVFEYVAGKIRVKVKNINGVADGTYYLGVHTHGSTTLFDALCLSVEADGKCTESSASTRTICQGQSLGNPCFAYNTTTMLFTIDSKNLAPGVMWFDGNLKLANGNYYNTFLSTKGIETAGSTTVTSLNYGGYNNTCLANYQGTLTLFTGLYPKNFCKTSDASLIANALGNPALTAGGFDPSMGGTIYSGGDIKLGASTVIYGTVLAGDTLNTAGGNTTVRGYITAAALTTDVDPNILGGTTIIDLTGLPSTYTPSVIPDMTTPPPADPDVARVLWSRFL